MMESDTIVRVMIALTVALVSLTAPAAAAMDDGATTDVSAVEDPTLETELVDSATVSMFSPTCAAYINWKGQLDHICD
jgi:hypothetical protein